MVKRRDAIQVNWLDQLLEDNEKAKGTYVKSRFYVVEITPSEMYRQGDGHGGTERAWTKQKQRRVSFYYDTKGEVEKFMAEHVADEGSTLEMRQDKLYRRTVEEWF